MALEWHGAAIGARVVAAELAAVDETTKASADEARGDHWWTARGGPLERETISEPARPVAGGVVGKFGTTRKRGFYGLFLELQQPFLRPIADRVFPSLAERLHERYRAGK
jgi:hypothetical protein